MQADVLDRHPDDGQAIGLRREHVNLIGTLPYIAEEAFDGVGGLDGCHIDCGVMMCDAGSCDE
ncbi:MAG TPA: hypothetical protein VF043_01175 [Ktedonobacteraceae bacterium]